MIRFFVLFFGMGMLFYVSMAQNSYTLSGVVVDECSQPLPGASVKLYPAGKGSVADGQGSFVVQGLGRGTYAIEITFVGYEPTTDTISISNDTVYHARLSVFAQNIREVVITVNLPEKRRKEEPLAVDVINDSYLKKNLGGSLMKTLARLPGLSTIDIGAGQSKPVIRGLGFNRVVVVENSIKHEAQQWGADHGLEIDQYAINYVEVIKGPASLMYGSDAIGGVIDMKNKFLPRDNMVGGTVDLSGKTNNGFLGTSVAVYGRKEWFFAGVRATLLNYGDYRVPTDSVDIYSYRAALYRNYLRNTAGTERNMHLMFGFILPEFHSRFFVSNVENTSGFFANAHGLEPRNVDAGLHDKSNRDIHYPRQEVAHFKLINKSQFRRGKSKIESDLGYQHNFRQEWSQYVNHGYMPHIFPDTLGFSPDLERQFDKYIYTGNLNFTYDRSAKIRFRAGVASDYQDNRIGGRGFIIPAYKQFNIGAYGLTRYAFSERSILQMGVRYDFGRINTVEYRDWFPSPGEGTGDITLHYLKRADRISRNFSNVSWSAGYNYTPANWTIKTHIGRSYRMPIAKELAANGVNYHHFSYEVGNAALSPEISYQFDAGVEYATAKFTIAAAPFLNYFSNYIYLNPGFEHDRLYGNGNQIFFYTQSEVFRYGAEIHAQCQIAKPLLLSVTGEHVYSRQLTGDKKGFSLPFSPPASVILNVQYRKQQIRFLKNPYVSIDYKITAAQDNIVPPEVITAGYQVMNTGFGGDVKLKNQMAGISMQVQNLFNRKYFNHTSYYRLINVPEPGRNFIVNITVPF